MQETGPIDARIIAPLVDAILKDSNPDVRRSALRAVVRLPLSAESWIGVGGIVYHLLRSGVFSLLHGGDKPSVPLADAIEAAAFIPVQQVRDALRKILRVENAAVRRATAQALPNAGDPAGMGILIGALGDADPWSRYQTSKYIYGLRSSTAPF